MSLLKNELIKIFSQLSFKIMMILVLIIALIIPYFFNITNDYLGYEYSSDNIQQTYDDAMSYLATFEYDDCDSYEIAYEIAYQESIAETAKFYLDNANENWRFNLYKEGSDKNSLISALMVGKSIDIFNKYGTDAANCWYVNYIDVFMKTWLGDSVPEIEWNSEENDYYNYLYSSVDYSKIDFTAAKQEADAQINSIKSGILSLDATKILKEEKTYITDNISFLNEQLSEAKEIYNASSTEENKRTVTQLTDSVELNNNIAEIYDIMINGNKTPDDWLYKAINALQEGIELLDDSLAVSEKVYNENPTLHYDSLFSAQFPSYDDYKRTKEKDYDNVKAGIDIVMTAVKENTQLPIFAKKSTKTTVITSMSSQISLICLFTVILAAITVSSEYSSGTIRLLLIRPKTRRKILASKYGAVLLCSLMVTLVSFIIISVVTILQNGVADFFANDIIRIGNTNLVLPSVCGFGIRLILDYFQITLLTSITILIAVLVKKSALSITLPMILIFISSIVQIFTPALTVAKPITEYTILPYFNLSSLYVSPANLFADSDNILQLLFGNVSVIDALRLNLLLGIIIYAVHIAVVIWCSSISFRKQQI